MDEQQCPLCGQLAKHWIKGVQDNEHIYDCPNCKVYRIDDCFLGAISNETTPQERAILSGYIREMNENGDKTKYLTYESYKIFLSSFLIPRTIGQKLNKLLIYFYKNTVDYGQIVKFNPIYDTSVCYANNVDECNSLLEVLDEQGYTKKDKGQVLNGRNPTRLTFKGISAAELISEKAIESRNAFIAMWFSPDMIDTYEKAIKPAVEKSSFSPFRIDNYQHNNDITDEIIAGIKNCRFVIADMTGYRGGVYYEAGYAKGLGKPVIYTCRKDWFYGEIEGELIKKERVHFDINHQNFIVWGNHEELQRSLYARIQATII